MRVVVADDSMLLRKGLSRLLVEVGSEVVGKADDAAGLLRQVALTEPDVAIPRLALCAAPAGSGSVLTHYRLTDGEREVLRLMAEGYSNRAIADDLFLSPRSAEARVHKIFLELGLEESPDSLRLFSLRQRFGTLTKAENSAVSPSNHRSIHPLSGG